MEELEVLCRARAIRDALAYLEGNEKVCDVKKKHEEDKKREVAE